MRRQVSPPARQRALGLYALCAVDAVAVLYLVALVGVVYDSDTVESPNVAFPILAAVAAASLAAGAIGVRARWARLLVTGVLLLPLLAVVVALSLPSDTAT